MNPKILAVLAVSLAWLYGRHVTVWLAGQPVATVPALAALGVAAACAAAALAFALWRFRTSSRAWRTT